MSDQENEIKEVKERIVYVDRPTQPTVVIHNNSAMSTPPRSKIVTLVLCIFLGWLGIHRFYTGHIITAIIYLFSGGLLGVGIFIDFLYILSSSYKDKNGVALT